MIAKGSEMSHLAKLGKSEKVGEMLENYGFLKECLVAVDRFELSTPRI